MQFVPARLRALAGAVLALSLVSALPAAPAVPGFNVHTVHEKDGNHFLRGGAPRKDTMEALARSAKARGKKVTLVDLRKPAYGDDKAGKGGRLSPANEEIMARKMGFNYVAVSALDKTLPEKLRKYHSQGDVYMHCQYGVNRTGYATARFSVATGTPTSRDGLGKRDWKQGEARQKGMGGRIR